MYINDDRIAHSVQSHTMMRFALSNHGREIDAHDLESGCFRSNTYTCCRCRLPISYVARSARCTSHFRHAPGKSCVRDTTLCDAELQSSLRVENLKSRFHREWQSVVPSERTEIRLHDGDEVRIADILLELHSVDKPFTLRNDSGIPIMKVDKGSLVIEVQHSNITRADACGRETFYTTDHRDLLWIFNIEDFPYYLEHVLTITQDKYRLRFPSKQHTGLANLYAACSSQPNVLLDTGKHLFHIARRPFTDQKCIDVHPVSRRAFIEKLGLVTNVNYHVFSEDAYTEEPHVDATLDSRSCTLALDVQLQADVDDAFNIVYDMPLYELRKSAEYFSRSDYYSADSYIDMIAFWLGVASRINQGVLACFMKWLQYVRMTYYEGGHMPFGKYTSVPLRHLPQTYLNWLIDNDVLSDKYPELHEQVVELCSMSDAAHVFRKSPAEMHCMASIRSFYTSSEYSDARRNLKALYPSLSMRPWMNASTREFIESYIDLDREHNYRLGVCQTRPTYTQYAFRD